MGCMLLSPLGEHYCMHSDFDSPRHWLRLSKTSHSAKKPYFMGICNVHLQIGRSDKFPGQEWNETHTPKMFSKKPGPKGFQILIGLGFPYWLSPEDFLLRYSNVRLWIGIFFVHHPSAEACVPAPGSSPTLSSSRRRRRCLQVPGRRKT
jgi:hypothetical protein